MEAELLEASYFPIRSIEERKILKKYFLNSDNQLSQPKQRVYLSTQHKQVYVVYPGTQDFEDLHYDAAHLVGQESAFERFRKIRENEKRIEARYGKEYEIDVLGHSLGGAIATRSIFPKRTTYNKLAGWNEITGRTKPSEKQTDHRHIFDLPSLAVAFQSNTKNKPVLTTNPHSLKQFHN